MFEFESKRQKTKGKGIRKFRIKEKGKRAQLPPSSTFQPKPAQLAARARLLTGGPHLLASCPAHSLASSLSLSSGTAPSAPLRAHAHPLSLARGPCPSTRPLPPQPPHLWRVPRARSNRDHAPTTYPRRPSAWVKISCPSQLTPASHLLSPCLRAHSAHSVAPSAILSSSSGLCHCLGHGELCRSLVHWEPVVVSLSPIPLPGPRSTSPLHRSESATATVSCRPANRSPLAQCQDASSVVSR
jgi:hypothetical protein